MIQIPVEELLDSLKEGYTEYKKCAANGNDEVDLAHIKSFCTTIEQILRAYGDIAPEEIRKIKEPIIGNISLGRKKKNSTKIDLEADLEEPTIFRRKK